MRSIPAEEEGVRKTTCDEQAATPVLHPPAQLRGEGRESVEPGKKRGVEDCFFYYQFLFLII